MKKKLPKNCHDAYTVVGIVLKLKLSCGNFSLLSMTILVFWWWQFLYFDHENYFFVWIMTILSACIMAILVYGSWQLYFLNSRFIMCQNLLLNIEENSWKISLQLQCKHHGNSYAIDMATFNPKKLSKYIDMRFSFEDLVARDLMVKTDFQSDFSFKRLNI